MITKVDYQLSHIDDEAQYTPAEVMTEYRRLILHSRESLEFHTPYEVERQMHLFIQNGEPECLSKWLQARVQDKGIEVGAMSGNNLTQSRCMFMAGLTLYTRSAIKGGLDQEMAYNLSDAYIHVADASRNPSYVLELMILAALDFAQRVKVSKTSGTPAVKLCRAYISDHLHYKITLDELAEACSRSPNYLSSLFREQMGVSLKEYILNEKLDAASQILLTTNFSVSQVASQFAFCSHSNFAAHFKRRFGVTPQLYRAKEGCGR